MPLDLVDTLRQLVAIPSVNPMGGIASGPDTGEARLTDYLESLLAGMGLVSIRQEAEPGRENLLARLDGDRSPENGGDLILFGVHQDTVPVAGMTIEPFQPQVRQRRLYGRGACDVKGGMAAMLAAVARLAHERPPGMPTIVIAFTVNEECGFTGARALAELCRGLPGTILPRKPVAAVIAEPTDLDVVVAHKGVVRWRCQARGRAAHSSRPDTGENAIYKMARALVAVDRYQHEIVGGLGEHPLCGRPTLSVGTIRGGAGVNIVPDYCVIDIDRRLLPGEDPELARHHLVEYLEKQLPEISLEHDPPLMVGLPLSDSQNQQLAQQLALVISEVAGSPKRAGVPYATDAALVAAAGVPTVVFGPGSIAQAHTVDEWIDLDELARASEIYYRFARKGVVSV